ncbi:hypothetical protein [Runella salmonicolor]|uniref:Uncharacterized protein n=1 Tax=Runella salmonicolor TaxID=2950278 RepID=A0ABT1FSE6_9BACT|nr:hypothetical protein [Runella salmonicolor]MCP1383553.1 hypothetical protein [Runella salmonicolor]
MGNNRKMINRKIQNVKVLARRFKSVSLAAMEQQKNDKQKNSKCKSIGSQIQIGWGIRGSNDLFLKLEKKIFLAVQF